MLCGDFSRNPLCHFCFKNLEFNYYACKYCATPKEDDLQLCGCCLNEKFIFDSAISPLLYYGDAVKLIHQIKYQGQFFVANLLVQLIRDKITSLPEAITFVPSHSKKLKIKGFNQSYILAKLLSKSLKIPLFKSVKKVKHIDSLVGLNKKARKKVLHEVFAVTSSPPKHIAIVDDLLTTGSTCNELSKELKKAGCDKIQVLTLARTIL